MSWKIIATPVSDHTARAIHEQYSKEAKKLGFEVDSFEAFEKRYRAELPGTTFLAVFGDHEPVPSPYLLDGMWIIDAIEEKLNTLKG